MTKEKFISKFKVGDKICAENWGMGQPEEIIFIDDKSVCLRCDIGRVSGLDDDEDFHLDWQHYKEPVEKDLENHKLFYQVGELNQYVNHFGWFKERPVYHDECEYITEEEAIERGLKV